MSANYHTYVLELQYLGFRYHGWQKQKDVKTVQYMLDRTLTFIYGSEVQIKSLGSSRTDRMVSALSFHCEIFSSCAINLKEAQNLLNQNLPADLKLLNIFQVGQDFQIIHPSHTKEYIYLFSYGEKAHPYSAPFIFNVPGNLDTEIMKEGAKEFVGNHFFKRYCYRPDNKIDFHREITISEVFKNNILTANFFPKNTFAFKVCGNGFLHHQVRIMMGTLIMLGQKKLSIADIRSSLIEPEEDIVNQIGFIAPSSGLHLYKSLLNYEQSQQS